MTRARPAAGKREPRVDCDTGSPRAVLLTSRAVMGPVLEAARLRVDVDGVAQVDGLSLVTTGERVLVLAGPAVLFSAAAGIVPPRHGEISTGGGPTAVAMREGKLAGAPLDPPLPPAWTALEYATWSARLAGRPPQDATALAREALGRLKLEALAEVRLRHAPLAARRALSVAAALATGAQTLFLEDPLRGLPEDAARTLARVLVRATAGLRTVVFAGRASLASPLAMDADEALVLAESSVLGQGAPAEVAAHDRTYVLRLHGRGAGFAELAARRGARVSGHGSTWTVDLGATLQLSDLLDVAAATETVVLELRPLAHAFA